MSTLGTTVSTTDIATTADLSTHAGAADPHTVYALESALGTMSTQAASSVSISGGAITGITDLAVADGGTGSSTAAAARTALGLVIGTDVAAPAKFGRSVHGGTTDFSFPGNVMNSATSTQGPTINVAYYGFMWTPTPITIDQCVCYVSTAPASTSNIRLGIYAADGAMQPSGAPLFDQTTTVANNFTGAKALAQTVVIPAGAFLTVFNCDVTMSLRIFRGWPVMGPYDSTLANGGALNGGSVAQTLGAFPNPGTAWTQGLFAGNHMVAVRISVP